MSDDIGRHDVNTVCFLMACTGKTFTAIFACMHVYIQSPIKVLLCFLDEVHFCLKTLFFSRFFISLSLARCIFEVFLELCSREPICSELPLSKNTMISYESQWCLTQSLRRSEKHTHKSRGGVLAFHMLCCIWFVSFMRAGFHAIVIRFAHPCSTGLLLFLDWVC